MLHNLNPITSSALNVSFLGFCFSSLSPDLLLIIELLIQQLQLFNTVFVNFRFVRD